MINAKREISAGIIIYRKTHEGLKFLILYHGHGYWNFPKGKIESEIQEKSFPAALREVKEETGLSRSDLRFNQSFDKLRIDLERSRMGQYFKTYEKFTFWRGQENRKIKVFKVVIFYLAETKNPRIRISPEHQGYGWFTYREAFKILDKYKDSQRVLKQAHDFLQKQKTIQTVNIHSQNNF